MASGGSAHQTDVMVGLLAGHTASKLHLTRQPEAFRRVG